MKTTTFEGMLLGEGLKFGIVVARFNDFITNKMPCREHIVDLPKYLDENEKLEVFEWFEKYSREIPDVEVGKIFLKFTEVHREILSPKTAKIIDGRIFRWMGIVTFMDLY